MATLDADDLTAIGNLLLVGGVRLADAVAHGGTPGSSTATLAIKAVNVTNPSGVGVTFLSGDGTNPGFYIGGFVAEGQFSGQPGMKLAGYDSAGLRVVADGTAIAAVQIIGNTNADAHGFQIVSATGTGKHDIALLGSADILGNLTGDVSGTVGSVTGAVGSVTGAVGSVTGAVGSVTTKTGYSLASTGLDLVAVTAPSGVATTFPGMVVQLWRRFFKKGTKTATQIKTYGDDGSTVVTTQTISSTGGTDTQGAAS